MSVAANSCALYPICQLAGHFILLITDLGLGDLSPSSLTPLLMPHHQQDDLYSGRLDSRLSLGLQTDDGCGKGN